MRKSATSTRPSLVRLGATLAAASLLHGGILWQVSRHTALARLEVAPALLELESPATEFTATETEAPESTGDSNEPSPVVPSSPVPSPAAPAARTHLPPQGHGDAPPPRELPAATEATNALDNPPTDSAETTAYGEPAALQEELARGDWFGEFASLPSGPLAGGAAAGGTASDRAGHSAAAARGALARTSPATRARLTSGGVHVCQDVLGLQHFRGEPSALVKVAIDREGDVRFAGLAAPHPGGAALERATAACVSRFRFAPARDEQGRATASSAVLKLTAAR